MKQELYLNNYLVELYNQKLTNSFENYYDFVMSYNTRIGEYKMDIDSYSRTIYDYNINIFKKLKIKFSTKEFKKTFRTKIIFNNKNYPTGEAIVHVPVFYNNMEKINKILLEFIIKNKICCNIVISKYNKNDIYNIKCFEFEDALKIINYYDTNITLIKEMKNKLNPLFLQINEIGLSTELLPYNYNNEIIKISYEYLNSKKKKEKIKYDDFLSFINDKSIKEKRILKKLNYNYILKIIQKMKEKDKLEEIFYYNADMNLGSIDQNEYSLKLDKNNLLLFEKKEGNFQIQFGSEDYLNISYSKIYKNIIGKSENLKFYNYFRGVFINLFLNHYYKIEELFNFKSLNENLLNQQLMMNACAYFGLVKFNISLDDINKILSIAYDKILGIKINLKVKENNENQKKETHYFPFSVEYGNKIIDKKTGEKTSIYDYYYDNSVLNYINEKSIVTLKNNTIMSGLDFLKYSEQFFDKYDNFKNILDDLVDFIELKD